jgi:glycosyltransferase involved in cell wall biosynthesis
MRNMKIYAQAPAARYNASIYYRCLLPLWTMHKMRLPIELEIDDFDASLSNDDRFRNAISSDIYMMYQVITPMLKQLMNDARSMPYQYAPNGDKLASCSFVIDTDDDLFNVSPLNSAFANLGYKDFHGNLLKDGDKIWGRHPGTNEPILMWEDGGNVDYAVNRAKLDAFRENLRGAELITCSTEGTKEYVLRELGDEAASKIHIFPNCIDLGDYPKIDLAPHPDEIRILWQGSPTHWEDLVLVKDAMARVAKKNPRVKFIFWGADYPVITSALPASQCELISWNDYRIYKLRLATIGHDIAIAPLRESVFNNARSAIKWYESSSIWRPAATVAANVGPFKREMEDGKTGLLFDNPDQFEEKLQALIDDETLRNTLASNAKDWVKTNRDPVTHSMKLFEKYQEVRAARLTWPEKENGTTPANDGDVRGSETKDS